MSQVTITAEELKASKEILQIVVFPLLGWFLKRAFIELRTQLLKGIEEIRSSVVIELQKYVDIKFAEHEVSVFSRLTTLENTVRICSVFKIPEDKADVKLTIS